MCYNSSQQARNAAVWAHTITPRAGGALEVEARSLLFVIVLQRQTDGVSPDYVILE